MSERLLGSFVRVLYSEILCAFYYPTSSQFQPTSFRKHEKGTSSSDSISLSTSSSESMVSERSRDRQVDEEGTSSRGMISGIPMETVREV